MPEIVTERPSTSQFDHPNISDLLNHYERALIECGVTDYRQHPDNLTIDDPTKRALATKALKFYQLVRYTFIDEANNHFDRERESYIRDQSITD